MAIASRIGTTNAAAYSLNLKQDTTSVNGTPNDSKLLAIAGNQQLPELSDTEVKFLLAYCGVSPKHRGPRTAAQAYLCLNPNAPPVSAHVSGKTILSRLKAKGLLTLILEIQGAGIAIATEALKQGLKAETIKRIEYPGGIWDYAAAPDHRTRRDCARVLLELHNVIGPEGVAGGGDAFRMTFAEAIAQQSDRAKSRSVESADFTEVTNHER
ncbi:hypothetical protein KJZ99_04165 [bacterium]|nr:hypothetical protein [bacterium]